MAEGSSGNEVTTVREVLSKNRDAPPDSGVASASVTKAQDDDTESISSPMSDLNLDTESLPDNVTVEIPPRRANSDSDDYIHFGRSSSSSSSDTTHINGTSDIKEVIDQLKHFKSRRRLTTSESNELQGCIDKLHGHSCELQGQFADDSGDDENHTNPFEELGPSEQVEDTSTSDAQHKCQEERTSLKFPEQLKPALAKIIAEDEVKKIENGSLATGVDVIYKHHGYSVSTLDAYQLMVDGFISFVLVTEVVVKVLCKATPCYASREAAKHIDKFLKDFECEEKTEIPNSEIFAGIRNSIAHSHAHYTSEDASFILYQRDMWRREYTEVYSCNAEKFTAMCASIRKVFLSWKEIASYLPEESKDVGVAEEENTE